MNVSKKFHAVHPIAVERFTKTQKLNLMMTKTQLTKSAGFILLDYECHYQNKRKLIEIASSVPKMTNINHM